MNDCMKDKLNDRLEQMKETVSKGVMPGSLTQEQCDELIPRIRELELIIEMLGDNNG